MEIIIESINIIENTKVVKSVNWSYGNISGTKELEKPNFDNFINFEKLDNNIVISWLENIIDFSQYNEFMVTPIVETKIITVQL